MSLISRLSQSSESKKRLKRKGFLLSLDAMIAITILLLLATFLAAVSFTYYYPELKYQRMYLAGKDFLTVMEKVKLSDLQQLDTVQELINKSLISDDELNKTLLDMIGAFWATDNQTYQDYARNLTEEAFNQTLPERLNYEVLIDGTSIYRKDGTNATFLSRLSTIVSGYGLGKPVSGWVARAWATSIKKNTTKVITFHPEGSARWGAGVEMWKYFDLNSTQIINATFYVSIHYTDLNNISVNGNDVTGDISWLHTEYNFGAGTAAFGVADVTSHIQSGNNTVYTNIENDEYNAHIHPGMRLEITYQTDEFESVSETVKERYYFDHIISHPNTGFSPKSGAWQMLSFYIPENATVKNVIFHIKAEDIEDTSSTDCRIWFNDTLYDSFDPPANQTVDKIYNFTDMTGEGTNWVLAQMNYYISWGDRFVGSDDTIIYSDPFNDPNGSSYLEVEYEREENKLYYGYIDIGMSENAGGSEDNPKTFSIDFENNTLINSFLHISQLFSSELNIYAWPEGQAPVWLFTSPDARVVPANFYIDPIYYDTSVLNYIETEDTGCNDCYILPETSLEYSIWIPSMVSYGQVNETEQGALDDAAYRLNQTLGKYAEATSIKTDTSSVSGIPSLWGPARVEVRVWM
ncbi:hypothetical protein ACFLQO_00615 [Candidatus Aenigmatarchaeota archaeon]